MNLSFPAKDGWMVIDDESPVHVSSYGILAMLNIDANIFLGENYLFFTRTYEVFQVEFRRSTRELEEDTRRTSLDA